MSSPAKVSNPPAPPAPPAPSPLVDIRVTIRRPEALGTTAVRAFADIAISLGAAGMVEIHDAAVVEPEGKLAFVSMPARKGKSKYFDYVSLHGKLRDLVTSMVLAEYGTPKRTA